MNAKFALQIRAYEETDCKRSGANFPYLCVFVIYPIALTLLYCAKISDEAIKCVCEKRVDDVSNETCMLAMFGMSCRESMFLLVPIFSAK